MDALITVSGFDDESAAWDAVTGKIDHLARVLLRLQYKSHCIRRHTKFLSEICLYYKTCHTILSKLEQRTPQLSIDVTSFLL